MNCRYEFAGIPEYATGVEWARLETPNSELVRRGENIKPLKNLLVVIAATGVIGSAQAQTPGNTFDLGTLSPTVQATTDTFASGSFLDTFNFTIGATNQNVLSSTVALGPDGTPNATAVTGLTYQLFSGLNAPGTPLSSILIDSSGRLDLRTLLTPGDFSVRISGTAGPVGGGFSFTTAANPEPAEWMMLLAGLVVVGFMARRKTRLTDKGDKADGRLICRAPAHAG